jgi:hypothetical protein
MSVLAWQTGNLISSIFVSEAVFTLANFSTRMPATRTRDSDMLVLALATLGGMTEIGSFLFYAALPKVTKASKKA